MAAHTNRLIHEKSPYLLQHAHNPVDWYPWGQEAFEAAKTQDKLIFLSIGYATCHWCHVMERESFENVEIAALLNDTFINIKVDREERPEIDSIYMDFAQALMSSASGWPLNLVLTPDLKPFFAVTYLPPVDSRGLVGMTHFIKHIKELWQSEERKQLVDQADKIVEIFEKMAVLSGEEMPDENTLHTCVEVLYELMDPIFGGWKGEPKFPLDYQATFLLEYAALKKESRALFCTELALDKMHSGGIYDHLGGGFSRYCVDEQWIVPHFEKMLYDNALLLAAYLHAWKFTKKEIYKNTCQDTLQYILRDMSHPEGGYYSAEDAETNGHEGLYYTWTPAEVREVLGEKEAEGFCRFYDVTPTGNFEGRSILNTFKPQPENAETLSSARALLLKKRGERPRPLRDDKIITAWNALMIDSMIQAAFYFEDDTYKQSALKAAEFIKTHLYKEGHLLRRWRENEARFHGSLEDYAFLIRALLNLFCYGAGTQWLEWALQLTSVLEKEFKAEGGAFYHSTSENLILRKCEFYDGAEPSGNAVHAENLLRLHQICSEEKYLLQAQDIFKAAKNFMETYPIGACYHLIALNRYLNPQAATIVISLDEERSLEKEILAALRERYLPHAEIIWYSQGDTLLPRLIPSLVDKNPIDGQTAVYICHQDHCAAPLLTIEEILQKVRQI